MNDTAHGGGPPATPTEKVVARLWSELLQRETILREDNFFALGGDSMAMVVVHFRMGESLGMELPPGLLAEHPTLSGFCAGLDRLRDSPDTVTTL